MEKAEIVTVGWIIDDFPRYFVFNCKESAPLVSVTPCGILLVAGYTMEELQEISDNFWGGINI